MNLGDRKNMILILLGKKLIIKVLNLMVNLIQLLSLILINVSVEIFLLLKENNLLLKKDQLEMALVGL